jgi:WD40 repeat protein
VRAYATGRFAELRKWVARNRTLSLVIAGSLLALLAGAVAVTTLWVRAEDDRARADASAARLQNELERSTFQRARQALQLDNSMQAADTLWHAHLLGNMPRATAWALKELAERDPYLVAVPERADRPIAFLPGGDLLLVGGADGRLQLREPRTLATVSVLGTFGPRLTAVAPLDRRRAVAGTSRGDLLLFDLDAGSVVSRPAVHRGRITALAVAADGGFASGGADGRVLWWARSDAPAKEVLVHKAGLNALSLRPDGAAVMAAGDDGTLVGAAFDDPWRFSRRRLGDSLAAVAFTESADRLWVSDSNHQVRLVDLRDASRQWVHWTRNGACQQLARTRDGSVLVGGWWRTDRWTADGSSHTPVALRPVDRFALSPDQRWLATTSAVSGLGVIDLAPIARRRIPGVGALGLSGDGRFIATSAGNHATIHDVTTGTVAKAMPKGSNGWLALDRDGTHLSVSKMPQGTLAVYDVREGTQLYTTAGPTEGSGFAARFSPDGAELAFAAGPGKLRRVRTADGAPLAEYFLTGVTVGALSWSGDGRSLAAVGSGLTAARLFDLATGSHRDEEFAGSWPANATPALTAVALSHDGHTIAAGNLAGQVRVRRRDGSTLAVAGHDGTVWSLQFAGDDPGLLFSSGGAQGLAAWDLDSGECCYQSLGEQLSQLQVSVDGATLACMTPDGALLVDLAYHDRHVAGNLPMHLPAVRNAGGITPSREASLQAWAAAVMARPWPRWQ